MPVRFTPRLERAVRVAATAHRDQKRKGSGTPYITHPFSVMTIASGVTADEDTLIACLFHDILEDVPEEYSQQQMRLDFGNDVVEIVRGVTYDPSIKDWHKRCEAYLRVLRQARDESIIVSSADKIHNLMSTLNDYEVVGDDIWQIFSTKNAADQLWWYESVLAVMRERQAPPSLIEQLSELIDQLEPVAGN